MNKTPFFSIITPVYDRENIIRRAIESCLNQTFLDFELIVVDDGSTDNTAEVVRSVQDSRLRFIRHPLNRGIGPARNTAASQARGEWVVTLDSDWALLPNCLSHFHEIIREMPPDVGLVGARHQWDTGQISPLFVPERIIDYEGRIKWIAQEGGGDAVPCRKRNTLTFGNWYSSGRGGTENIYQLNLAQHCRQFWLKEILCLQFSDAPNSHSRASGSWAVNNLLRNAGDVANDYEMGLKRHGEALRRIAPNIYAEWIRSAGTQHFLAGHRILGYRYLMKYLKRYPLDIISWLICLVGLIGPVALAKATIAKRTSGL